MERAGRWRNRWSRIGLAASVCASAGLGAGVAAAWAASPSTRIDGAGVDTVFFADKALAPVQVIHGLSLPEIVISPEAVSLGLTPDIAAPEFHTVPQSVEIVRFANDPDHPVRVVRGGGALVADAASPAALPDPGQGTTEIVRFDRPGEAPVTVVRGPPSLETGSTLFGPARGFDLARIAFAVDGAESSHGMDPRMWRTDWSGPQGPMQVSAAAALDVGGGDRFDAEQNRALGQAYLAQLYAHYGNWPDAIAAYDWGPGNMDQWIALGRPAGQLPSETRNYLDRVLRDALLDGAPPAQPM